MILPWAVEAWGFGHPFHVSYGHHDAQLRAIENVFSALDGKGSISKTHNGLLVDAINQSADGRGETDYFRFRCFKNRNLHLEFRRLDLLARFNQIAGGARLRPKAAE